MSSYLLLWGGVVVLCSMASSILSFSHGASRTSCQEMIPGHIRAHPLDPKLSFINIQTSSSSYLPGQLLTVTVRSSRDFMGFLLQARSVGGERNGFGGGHDIRRLGPLLVGGSWIRSPPGTHTLRCLFEGDTVTHSDKQLKRNLSFVWRAPDMPKGDIRFHLTVVQSYFIYWTGIESEVVRDRSAAAWRGSRTKMVDGASIVYAVQETVTAQTALRDNKVQKNHTNDGATPGPFLGRHTKLKAATEIQEFLQLQTKNEHSNFPTNSTLWINHIVTRRKTLTLGFPPSITKKTPGLSLITDPFSHSTSPFPLLDTRYMVTSTNYPLTKFSSLNRHGPVSPHKDVSTKSMDLNIKSQEQNPGRNTTMTPNTTQGQPTADFYSTYTPKPEYQILKQQGKNKSAKPETSSSAEKVTNNHTTSQMNRIKTEVTPPSYQASSFKSLFQTVESNVDLKTQIDTSQTLMGAKSTPKQTNSPLTTTTQIHQAVHVTETPQSIPLQEEKTQTDTSTESYRPSFQPQGVYSQSLLTKQLFAVSRGENNLKSQGNAKRMTQVDGLVPSNSQSSFTTIDYPVNSTSSDSSHNTSVVPLGENFTLQQSGGSVTSLKHPSVTSKSSNHSITPHSMNKAKTIPAHSVPPSPFPISVPPHLTARQYYTSPQPTFPTPSAFSSFSATNHPTATSLPTTTFPQCITTSSFSTSSTRSQASSSFSYNSVPTLSPLPFSVTPPSISPPLKSSSSYFTSTIASPYQEPTSATPLFRNTPFLSLVPRKTTVHERLLTGSRHQFSKTHFTSLAQRKLVHPNPKPYPNLRPNPGQEINPNILNIQPKRPSDPSETPDMDGKYPDIIPRHRAWEIGMLLGCSAGLGMVLVVGIRYVYRKACGRRTEVTLNDREREYGRGGHGLIQLQECGDLVRVRKIRENSFVLLAEYDILPSATN